MHTKRWWKMEKSGLLWEAWGMITCIAAFVGSWLAIGMLINFLF